MGTPYIWPQLAAVIHAPYIFPYAYISECKYPDKKKEVFHHTQGLHSLCVALKVTHNSGIIYKMAQSYKPISLDPVESWT